LYGLFSNALKFDHKIFTLYQRFHLSVEGKRLGLFLVKTQVNALNGTIDVESKPEAGATFVVKFPIII
jgi:signal transduction histidine kinase